MEKQKKSILIIDDDKSILNIFTRILQKQGYKTDTAETGQEALEKLQASSFHLAIIDVKLPDTNGTDLLVRINQTHPNMIKIAITGFPSLEDATKVIDRGAAAYLVKPVKSEELISIIAEKLKKQQTTDAHHKQPFYSFAASTTFI
jgi:DNA-binding NtrC family response regulator